MSLSFHMTGGWSAAMRQGKGSFFLLTWTLQATTWESRMFPLLLYQSRGLVNWNSQQYIYTCTYHHIFFDSFGFQAFILKIPPDDLWAAREVSATGALIDLFLFSNPGDSAPGI